MIEGKRVTNLGLVSRRKLRSCRLRRRLCCANRRWFLQNSAAAKTKSMSLDQAPAEPPAAFAPLHLGDGRGVHGFLRL